MQVEKALIKLQHASKVVLLFPTFVYPEDEAMLNSDLELLLSGEKDEHNLEYRWLDLDGQPVWINCRGYVVRAVQR